MTTTNLRCEYKTCPLGIGETAPRLSWEILSEERNVLQRAYHIRVAESAQELSSSNLLWDSGKVESNQSNQVVYEGKELASSMWCYWQVKVWDNKGNESNWSEVACWSMGLLGTADWKAQWVEPGWEEDPKKSNPVPMFRKEFDLSKKVDRAIACISARGLYEVEINGQKVGDQEFTPGWTTYQKRLQYQTFEVTHLLKSGGNAIGAYLGDGWYRGNMGWENHRNHYGEKVALLFQLELVYKDGEKEMVISDDSWKGSTGGILESDIYNGEVFDASLEPSGWSMPGFDDTEWRAINVVDYGYENLIASQGVPVRQIQEINPVEILKTPKAETVIDFGQNLVGKIRLRVKGEKGTVIKIYHAETLDRDGNFYTANLRSAKQQLTYKLKGEEETYEPKFTFMGFRYVKIEGLRKEIQPEDITAIVIHSDMAPTGNFECSNPLLNQLQKNIQWGQKGNFLDVPTDCPQRDERMGWTGDAQVFASTAAFNMDVFAFFSKWLADLAADQDEDGSVPSVIPSVLSKESNGRTGWSDAATIIPWQFYLEYGDKRLLERQYPSMKAWVNYMRNQAGSDYLWQRGEHYGDWLFYSVNDDRDGVSAITQKYFLTQCFFAHSTDLLCKAAKVLDKKEDWETYSKLFEKVKTAFQREYITPNGRLTSDTQTAYVLALQFDLFPEHLRQQAVERLVKNIRLYNTHLTTGFLGTPFINHVLTKYGYLYLAYELLLQDTWPSWLYPVKKGATTIWERWDGIRPDGTFQEASMNSFNHYAYGAIGDWMYQTIGGIQIDEARPGYQHFVIHPQVGGGLAFANTWHQSLYGRIESNWKLKGGLFILEVLIPANTTAAIVLNGAYAEKVKESGQMISENGDFEVEQGKNWLRIELGSGKYIFEG